ncbi:hypothetical protein [Streptacidiphilus sp. PAMC 29251]
MLDALGATVLHLDCGLLLAVLVGAVALSGSRANARRPEDI